jgi:hypothetical protein
MVAETRKQKVCRGAHAGDLFPATGAGLARVKNGIEAAFRSLYWDLDD